MNIFFFGGTFDPPHKAHKLIYKYCINLCDKFIFIPTSQSPDKYQPSANTKDRIKMLELLIDEKDSNKVMIDQFEVNSSKKPNYTIDTILYLKEKFNHACLNMVIGEDQYKNLINWKNYNDIIEQVNIICFKRNLISTKDQNINFIDFNFDISSTKIKKHIIANELCDIEDFLTSKVYDFIIKKKLYRNINAN